MDSPSSSIRNPPRPRLLHSCGASLLTKAHKAYRRAEEFNNPLGSFARSLASITTPILHPMQHQWLSILSFFDDLILAIEDVAMTVFPPSTHLFNGLDELALFAKSLPKWLDDVIDSLPLLLHQLPLVESVLKHFLYLMGSWNVKWSDEREIMVDIKCGEQESMAVSSEEFGGVDEKKGEGESVEEEEEEDVIRKVEETCKEIMEELEMVEEEKGTVVGGGDGGGIVGKEEGLEEEREVVVVLRDPILELFDEGWQFKLL